MDILLTHGYFLYEDPHELAVMKPYPPLGLLYISSHLKAKRFQVEVYDTTFSRWHEFEQYVKTERPSLVGLYTNLMTKQNVLRMISLFKQQATRVILGGPDPPYYADEYLSAGADIVVIGEGELTLEELIPHLARHNMEKLDEIQGIAFRHDEGEVVKTPARPQIADLSAQPWPDREAIDFERYLTTWQTHHGVRSASLITARGCPYTCTWCSHSVFGETHRRRTVEDVADEVVYLAERYKPDQLWYADDVFTIHPRWFQKYAAELKKRSIRIPFESISRADRLNEQIMDTLSQMGCYRLWIGSESGSQRILDAMKRKTDATDVQIKSRMLQARGIQVGMFIMLGYDGEDISDLEATVAHLKKSNPDVFLTTVAYPIKGTSYYEAVTDRVYSNLDWRDRSDRDLGVAGRFSTRFYDHATRWMVNEVNLHKLQLAGSRNYARMVKLLLHAKWGRLGMYLTKHEREGNDQLPPAGRGWGSQERTADAW
ncbi:B12-binding domain-containing radical SAM protein [Chloroflexi bacterium TSY]|nr:B12-binding domain-containing radical SAM protein [Chloroflexi bacterium TSY]